MLPNCLEHTSPKSVPASLVNNFLSLLNFSHSQLDFFLYYNNSLNYLRLIYFFGVCLFVFFKETAKLCEFNLSGYSSINSSLRV